MKNKTEKIKEAYTKFKEDWKDPRKRAGIKLSGYLVFFLIIFIMGMIANAINSVNYKRPINTTTTSKLVDEFLLKQNDLLNKKYNIKYVININNIEYKINGYINNGVIEGYFESNDDIKKIMFKNNAIYEIKNNEEVLLELDINNNFIDVQYIINMIKQSTSLETKNDIGKTYTYTIDGVKIVFETNDKNIIKIFVLDNNDKYELSFDI